jgi:predicted ribosome quality control (RQC) complex YloA/Tae2 family protein
METPTINEIDLLKIGRHFRLDEETKFVVGRNKDENEMIKALALPGDILLEAKDYVGPVSILRGKNAKLHVEFASAVTLRYSDASKNQLGVVLVKNENSTEEIKSKSAEEKSYIKFRM